MALHPLQTNPAFAEKEFNFLARLGFALQERWVTGGESFRDGWRLTFLGPKIKVVVQYMDAQFEVHFVRGDLDVSYLEMDRDLFARRSGFHGDMFPPQKLEAAVTRIAADIRANYGPVLGADDGEWNRIGRLKTGPPKAPRLP
jgi:hypothetical protein